MVALACFNSLSAGTGFAAQLMTRRREGGSSFVSIPFRRERVLRRLLARRKANDNLLGGFNSLSAGTGFAAIRAELMLSDESVLFQFPFGGNGFCGRLHEAVNEPYTGIRFQFPFGGNGFCGWAKAMSIEVSSEKFQFPFRRERVLRPDQCLRVRRRWVQGFNSLSAGTGFAARSGSSRLRREEPRFNSLSAGTGFAAFYLEADAFEWVQGFNSLSAGTGFAATGRHRLTTDRSRCVSIPFRRERVLRLRNAPRWCTHNKMMFQFPFGGNGFCGQHRSLPVPRVGMPVSIPFRRERVLRLRCQERAMPGRQSCFNSLSAGTGFAAGLCWSLIEIANVSFQFPFGGNGFCGRTKTWRNPC